MPGPDPGSRAQNAPAEQMDRQCDPGRQRAPLSQPNPGVPGFGPYYDWSKSETSDLDAGEGKRSVPRGARNPARPAPGPAAVTPHPARCSLHSQRSTLSRPNPVQVGNIPLGRGRGRSEEHTSELQQHSFISYAVFC